MSKIIQILIPVLIVLILSCIPVSAADNPTVIITGYQISPDVVMPSDAATITITLANTAEQASGTASPTTGSGTPASLSGLSPGPGNAFIESATLKTTDFQVINGWYEDVGEIGPGQAVNLTFFVKAPAKQGMYFPEAWIRIRDSGSVKYPIPVNVNSPYALSKQPSFRINRTVPGQVTPGSPFSLEVSLMNEGQSPAHDITVLINTPDRSISSLNPEQYYLRNLGPGETHTLNLSFVTDKEIPIGIVQFPLSVQYLTADNTRHEQKSQIGVRIQGKGELGISKYQVSPGQIKTGDMVSLIIRIGNTGTDDAKSVRASLDIPFDGIKEAFVGTIEPDNDAPAVFNLRATRPGEIPYTLAITFQDDYGTHTISEPLSLSVQQTDGNGLLILVVLLIVAGAAFLLYRRRKLP